MNVTGLNPQSHNDLWVVAANASGLDAALQTHVALLAFRARKRPPGFRDVTGEDGAATSTPALHVGATAASVAAALDEPGNVYLAVQSASAQALTSAQVRAKAAANESGTCSKLVPAANVEHVVPVGCPVFNLSQATSYAAYFVVEGLGLTFVTHGEPPSPPRPSRGSSSPRTTPRRAAPPRLALLRATASRSPRRARKTAWRISSSSRRVTPRPRSRTSCEAWARAALSPRLWDRSS